MAFAANQEQGGSSTFADNGTASHEWSAVCLITNEIPLDYLGQEIELNGAAYTMDEERAGFCQMYIDDVRRRAIGGYLYVEHHVDLSEYLGEGQGGTADAIIYDPDLLHLTIEDLKYGTGEKIYAHQNPQLMLYMLGALKDMAMLDHEVEMITGVICQPRLGHIDEYTCTRAELEDFGRRAALAVEHAGKAMVLPTSEIGPYLSPGEKQCRWCRAKSECPALSKFVSDEVKCDFETIVTEPPPVVPRDTAILSRAYLAVPLIEDWCRAVRAELSKLVSEGTKVIGPDGMPYKFVEGREGSRAWADAEAAEAALLGQLPPDKAYAPAKLITAPQAAKILDKKATKAVWKDVFEPLIKKPPGKPVLALGSDPRTPYAGSAEVAEFNDESEDLTQ